jgi:hypothetical protein
MVKHVVAALTSLASAVMRLCRSSTRLETLASMSPRSFAAAAATALSAAACTQSTGL